MFDDDFTEEEWAEHKAALRQKRIQRTINHHFSKQYPKIKVATANTICTCGGCLDCIFAGSWGETWRAQNAVLPR